MKMVPLSVTCFRTNAPLPSFPTFLIGNPEFCLRRVLTNGGAEEKCTGFPRARERQIQSSVPVTSLRGGLFVLGYVASQGFFGDLTLDFPGDHPGKLFGG